MVGKKKENFEQMQLFVLDFDGGISFYDVIDRTKEYDLPVLFSYETFSSVSKNKFRLVFLNDVSITEIKTAEIILHALHTIFPEADKHCNNVAHMYYGGKQLVSYDDAIPTIDIESLIRNMTIYLKNKHGYSNYKRYIDKFARETGIALTSKKMLDVSMIEDTPESLSSYGTIGNKPSTEKAGVFSFFYQDDKFLPRSIIVNRSNGKKLSNISYVINLAEEKRNTSSSSVDKKVSRTRTPYRQTMLDEISNSCNLYQEFESGSRRLHHHELLGIALNLFHIESGTDRFEKILENHPDLNYYETKGRTYWGNQFSYFRQYNYKPRNCNSFCPFKDTCLHGTNILDTVKPKYGTMEKLVDYEEKLYPLDEVVKDLKQNILSAISAKDEMIHIIKSPTAAGKTEISLDIMRDSGLKFLYANPTNILKDDIFRRAVKEKGIDVIKTPSLHDKKIRDYLPDDVGDHIDYLYNSGYHRLVDPYINKVAEEQDIECLKEYLNEKEKFHNYNGHVITTHRKLLHMDEATLGKFDVRIIDEDLILKTIIPNQVSIPIKALKELIKTAHKDVLAGRVHQSDYKKLHRKIMKVLTDIKTETYIELSGFEWHYDEDNEKGKKEPLDDTSTPIDVSSFCLAEKIYFRKASQEPKLTEDTLVFLKPIKLKEGFKYIIISATANEEIYKHYFGEDRVKFYECKMGKYEGTLNQFYGKSMSRTCIHDNPGIIEKLREWTGIGNIITFKEFAMRLQLDLYFGNAEGIDTLKGKDLNVIGAPYHAEFLYKLFAYTIGLDFDKDAKPIPNLPVTHNGYRFHFTTYKDEWLRKIQIWMIESDLEQAVGRARLLRYKCTVNLFSNLPLIQAVMQKFEYDKILNDKN